MLFLLHKKKKKKNPCWFWGEMWPGRVFFFCCFFTHSGSCLMDVQLKEGYMMFFFHSFRIMFDGCTAEGGLYDDDFVFVNDGWWKQWLFSGRLSEITDLIWKSFLNLLPPKEKKELLLTMFSDCSFLMLYIFVNPDVLVQNCYVIWGLFPAHPSLFIFLV